MSTPSSRIAVGVLLLLPFALLAPRVQAGEDPALRWRTLETDHFFMHYYQGEERLAREMLAMAEEAYAELTSRFGFEPSQRGHLVLVDDVDTANGLTMVVPYNLIYLYAYPPDIVGELGFWGDWKRILVYHELVHMFQLERVTGLLNIANYVLGKTFLPNSALPGWFLEGIAVLVESDIGVGGRIGGPLYSAYMRLAVAEDHFFPLDVATGSPLELPRGTVHYLYGSYFLHWLGERFGQDKLVAFVEEQAGKINPYSINISAHRKFGATFVELYEQWRADLTAEKNAELAAIRSAGVREGRRLAFAGESQPTPSFTPDGTLLFTVATGHDTRALHEWHPDGRVVELFDCRGGCDRPQQDFRGRIHYGSYEFFQTYYWYVDLFRYDRREADEERLTRGARVKDPAPDAGGERVAWVQPDAGRSRLLVHHVEEDRAEVLVECDCGLSWPAWSPDGRRLAYVRQEDGAVDVWLYDFDTGTHRNVTPGASVEIQPAFSPDGQLVLVSSRTGVYNLYALDLTAGCGRQLTNVIGAAYSPTVSPDGTTVAYASYHHDGYYLQAVPLAGGECAPLDFAAPPAHRPAGGSPPVDETPVETLLPDRYCAVRHAYPRQWRPSMRYSTWDESVFGVETWGSDPVGHLSYNLLAEYDTVTEDSAATLSLSVDAWYPSINLFLGWYRNSLVARVADDYRDFREKDLYGSLSLSFPFKRTNYSVSLSMGYAFEHFTGHLTQPWQFDPGSIEPWFPPQGNLGTAFAGVSFDNTQSFAYSVTTEKGWRAGTDFRLSLPVLGSNWTEYQVKWRVAKYTRMPWLNHHVLKAQLRGGWAGGRDTFLRRFGVGGYPEQDIISDLINNTGIAGNFLRGYPPAVLRGSQYHYFSADYYFPLWRIRRGFQTFPLFAKDVYVNLFANGATAFDDYEDSEILWGTGAEVRLTTLLSYNFPFTFILGAAYGFQEPGGFAAYFLMGR